MKLTPFSICRILGFLFRLASRCARRRARTALPGPRPVLSALLRARSGPHRGGGIPAARGFAEAQPQAVQQIHFIAGEVRRVRAQNLIDLVAIGKMNFQVELRLGIAQLFPGITNLPGLLLRGFLGRMAEDNGAGLQRSGGTQDAVPQIAGGHHREANRLSPFFRDGEGLREQLLLDAAEKAVRLPDRIRPTRSGVTSARAETTTSRRPGFTRSSTLPR